MSITGQTYKRIESALCNSAARTEVVNILNQMEDTPATVAFTIGDETGNAIAVGVQCKDENGNVMTRKLPLDIVLSNGAVSAFNTETYTVAATSGDIVAVTANKIYKGLTTAAGSLTFTLTSTGTPTCQTLVMLPGNKYSASGNITHS